MVSKKLQGNAADFSKVAKEIVTVNLEDEVEKSFLSYAYLTIEDRSIPDARDGMKPVQRRILYTMYRDGNTPDKQHVKSAKIVGSCMGTLHPHGDSAIYEAMVRLAQPFTLMTPLVDGRGNFGDRPGAGAAAARYTEARMSKEAMLMVSELRERPVDFVPNYDQTAEQPAILPVQYPYLTVNGTSGIAVGFATNMAPHNPGEVVDATRWLLTHPNADLEKLMTFVPGPDFPTGCQILGVDGIKEAYETGRGKITMRAPYNVETLGRGKQALVFYELPYEVNSETIIEQLKKALKEGRIQGIADVKDLTDRRNGIRFVVETKAGVNVNALAMALYKNTDLEKGFAFNNIALVGGRPILLGLKQQLEIFIEHRIEVVTRRTRQRKEKREERRHLVEGLIKALANIDEVIKIVRTSDDSTIASEKLQKKFKIDDIQADYILEIPLKRLTKYDQLQLQDEKKKLDDEIAALNKILNDEKELRAVIGKELEDVKKVVDKPRASTIVGGNLADHIASVKEAASESLEVADEPCYIFLNHKGSVIRSPKDKASSSILSTVATNTRGKFIAVTNKGRGFRLEAIHVGNKSAPAHSILPEKLTAGEKVIALTPVELQEGKSGGIAIGTKNGIVKVTAPSWPVRSDEFSVISLEGKDEIVSATWVTDVNEYDFAFVTSDTSLLTFPANKVRPQGLSGGGMAGIKLAAGQEVLAFGVIASGEKHKAVVITASDAHKGKMTPLSLYPQKGRGTGGVRAQALLKGESKLAYAYVGAYPVLLDRDKRELKLPELINKRDASGKPLDNGQLPI